MKIPDNVQVIDMPTAVMWYDEDGILYSTPKPGAAPPEEMSREKALEEMQKFKLAIGLTAGKKACMILETDNTSKPPKKEDRDFIAEQLNEITKAMAVISSSPLSRMIANLFFGLKPPSYPVKFFSNEKDAKEWIKQYLD